MTDAAVQPGAEQRKRLVVGHDLAYKAVPEWNMAPELAGVGGVRASMNDMVKLAEALAGRRETPLKVRRASLPTDAATRREYVGAFELQPGFVITVSEDGERLMAQATGQGGAEIFREAPDAFFCRVVEARIVFNRGADGKVESLTLHQNGRQVPGRRLP